MSASPWKHVLLIDDLEKLSIKKDSSLQLALSLKEQGRDVYLLFEDDFYFLNQEKPVLEVYSFFGKFYEDSPYLRNFTLSDSESLLLDEKTVLHMRIDPPFDTRYLRYLWMLKALQKRFGVKVINDPTGIAGNNEKLVCYEEPDSIASYVGSSEKGFMKFINFLREDKKANHEGVILKPLDLFQGIGVEKLRLDDEKLLLEAFKKKKHVYNGPVVAQPFLSEVYKGEIRALFFNRKELGSIIKTPPEGEFLANIAQGAAFEEVSLSPEAREKCLKVCEDFAKVGVPWVAFDILADKIQEANITCPGLLVEVSQGVGENLGFPLIELIDDYLEKSF